MPDQAQTFFAPQLCIPTGLTDIGFYTRAFGAVELQRWSNDDGTLHVAELAIDGALFHVHEEKPVAGKFSPEKVKGTTALIGLFVSDVDAVYHTAMAAGGIPVLPPTTYEHDYRQAEIRDPFGHLWLLEKKMSL